MTYKNKSLPSINHTHFSAPKKSSIKISNNPNLLQSFKKVAFSFIALPAMRNLSLFFLDLFRAPISYPIRAIQKVNYSKIHKKLHQNKPVIRMSPDHHLIFFHRRILSNH